ncbi:hypothetical protein C0989_008633 [Termitomyces sp. Mn162]|nr:hypothetical protein C0989_008633 [Termitomyces sp. Mn162]
MAEGHPDDEQVNTWYKVAHEQWQLMELQCELWRMQPPTFPFPRGGFTPELSLLHLHQHPHDQQEELLIQLLAAWDATGTPSPDAPIAVHSEEVANGLEEVPAESEDF